MNIDSLGHMPQTHRLIMKATAAAPGEARWREHLHSTSPSVNQFPVQDRAHWMERCSQWLSAKNSYSGPRIKGYFTKQWSVVLFKVPQRTSYKSQQNEELVRQKDTTEACSSIASCSYWALALNTVWWQDFHIVLPHSPELEVWMEIMQDHVLCLELMGYVYFTLRQVMKRVTHREIIKTLKIQSLWR